LEEWAKAHKITNVKAHLAEAPLWLVAEYAMQDCILTWELAEYYKLALRREKPTVFEGLPFGDKSLFRLWLEIGGSYNDSIQRMEKNGLRVDRELVAESINMAEQKVDGLYQSMAKEVGRDFNPRSNPELRKILHLPKTNKAYLATSAHPLIPLLEEYRQWTRMLTTYYRPWLQLADENGYLHPSLLIHGTVAGRLSCRLPNMQNLPRLSDIYDVRRAIVAPEGKVLLEADLSQAELRLTTHYCMDPTWVEVYMNGGDIHQSTSDLLGLSDVYGKAEGRQVSKTLNFAMLYGMGAEALSSTLTMAGLPTAIDRAKQILFQFRGNKPTLVKLCKDLQSFARNHRYIELWTGRRRHYPYPRFYGMKDDTHSAPNNLIQGGVAELMRCIITDLDRLFEANRGQMDTPRMHLQVHDSILFSMKPSSVNRWLPIISTVMQESYRFRVPMKADFKVGESWASLKKVQV
jgi:DNA polymerase-1